VSPYQGIGKLILGEAVDGEVDVLISVVVKGNYWFVGILRGREADTEDCRAGAGCEKQGDEE
jgi:hypothetical protein